MAGDAPFSTLLSINHDDGSSIILCISKSFLLYTIYFASTPNIRKKRMEGKE